MTREDLTDVAIIANTCKSVPSAMVTKLLCERRDLLIAAKAVVQADDDQELDIRLINQLRAAIADAEGA